MLLGSNREPYEPEDVLVVFKEDGTADIAPITSVNDERVYAESPNGNIAVPLGDIKVYTGRKGRIFLYPSTVENVTDCMRIARLERSTVLRQITHFEQEYEAPAGGISRGKIILGIIAVLILIIFLAVK